MGKKILPALLLACFVFSAMSVHAQSDILKRADTYFDLKVFKSATESYKEYLQYTPDHKHSTQRLADSYFYLNNLEEAELWYERAVSLNSSVDYLFKYGKVLMMRGKYQEASEQFRVYAGVDKEKGMNFYTMCDMAAEVVAKNAPPVYKTEALTINTPGADFSPAIYGHALVFASSRNDLTRKGDMPAVNPMNHLFISPISEGQAGAPQFLRSSLRDNDSDKEGPISYSANGEWVAFVKNGYVEGTTQMAFEFDRANIYIARVKANGDWEDAIPFNHNGLFSNHFPHLNEDGTKLYFSSDRPGGAGGFDLYVSKRLGENNWSTPTSLGKPVNTPGNEISPFYAGTDLYFSSDYHQGFGGMDVYKAQFYNGGWKVYNQGTGLNSPQNDWGFVYDTKSRVAYFVTDREGNEDIFKATKASETFKLHITGASDGKPLGGAVVDISGCDKGSYSSDINGNIKLATEPGLDCRLKVSKMGYEPMLVSLGENERMLGIAEVKLFKKSEIYKGRILNTMTGAPIPGVKVVVLNQSDGHRIESFSDANGIYTLALQPRSKYRLKYSKAGYVEDNLIRDTGDGTDKSILPDILLLGTGTGTEISSLPKTTPVYTPEASIPAAPEPKYDEPIRTASDLGKPEIPDPTASGASSSLGSGEAIINGFSINLMSLSSGKTNVPDRIMALKGIGRIYRIDDGSYTRYRLGVFSSREEAKTALTKVKGAKGFERVFIVEEKSEGKIEEITNL